MNKKRRFWVMSRLNLKPMTFESLRVTFFGRTSLRGCTVFEVRHGCSNYQGAVVGEVPSTSEVTLLAKLWFQIWCIEHLPCVLVMGCCLLPFQTLSNCCILNNALMAIIMTAEDRCRKGPCISYEIRGGTLFGRFQWHVFVCCRCSMHVLWLPKQSKWENSGFSNSRCFGSYRNHAPLTFCYLNSLLKFAPKKKQSEFVQSFHQWEHNLAEWFEPAKEEAVRIFLEGGVPTSCWELRNRPLKTSWERVSGVHGVHMGNKWSTTGLYKIEN